MIKTMMIFLCGMIASYIAFNVDAKTFQAIMATAMVWIYSEVA